jgi:hypothetical protein
MRSAMAGRAHPGGYTRYLVPAMAGRGEGRRPAPSAPGRVHAIRPVSATPRRVVLRVLPSQMRAAIPDARRCRAVLGTA